MNSPLLETLASLPGPLQAVVALVFTIAFAYGVTYALVKLAAHDVQPQSSDDRLRYDEARRIYAESKGDL